MIKQDYKSKARPHVRALQLRLQALTLRWWEVGAVAIGVLCLTIAISSDSEQKKVKPDSGSVPLYTESSIEPTASLEPLSHSTYSTRNELPLLWDAPSIDDSNLNEIVQDSSQPTPSKTVTIKKGDTLSTIFKKQGFSATDVYRVTQDKQAKKHILQMRPGKKIDFYTNEDGQLEAFRYHLSVNESLFVERKENTFQSRIDHLPIEVRQHFAAGIINDSLFNAGKASGISDALIMKLANIFGWDIDFALDIRKNDSFAFIYEQRYLDGQNIGDGEILAAQFINQGEIFQAIRYKNKDGLENYFTPTGDSVRKAFLRTPVNFMYISSNFKPRRFHPILKRWKAHRGIDYRAPTGTPVYAAGDGKVIASSYSKYNGKYVFIQHGNNIITKYLHLSKRSVSVGKRVKQGQTIGHVGATGLAEAPHLHYEFVVNGVHRNPRTVKLPQAQPITEKELAHFKHQTQPLLAGLETFDRITISGSR